MANVDYLPIFFFKGLLLIYTLLAVVGLGIAIVFLVLVCILVYVKRSLRKGCLYKIYPCVHNSKHVDTLLSLYIVLASKQITTKNELSSCDIQ